MQNIFQRTRLPPSRYKTKLSISFLSAEYKLAYIIHEGRQSVNKSLNERTSIHTWKRMK